MSVKDYDPVGQITGARRVLMFLGWFSIGWGAVMLAWMLQIVAGMSGRPHAERFLIADGFIAGLVCLLLGAVLLLVRILADCLVAQQQQIDALRREAGPEEAAVAVPEAAGA